VPDRSGADHRPDWTSSAHPDTALQGVLSFGAWLVLALVGRQTQLRLFPKTVRAGER
jgi:hypothetical protein